MRQLGFPGMPEDPNETLRRLHYLGPARRGSFYADEAGIMVFASPTARNVPSEWLELSRWCLFGGENAGSRMWKRARRWLSVHQAEVSTVVSYSDPTVGHTGALYRACGWLWAPTWHRIVTPPTGAGSWDGKTTQAAKDRWIYPLRRDEDRARVLTIDESYSRRFPWSKYVEPKWRGRRFSGGGADFSRSRRVCP